MSTRRRPFWTSGELDVQKLQGRNAADEVRANYLLKAQRYYLLKRANRASYCGAGTLALQPPHMNTDRSTEVHSMISVGAHRSGPAPRSLRGGRARCYR